MTRIALALGLVCFAMPALAACPSPLTGKDAAGTTQNFGITVDGSGNCYGNVALVDGTNAANKAAVTAAGALKVDNSGVTQPSNVTQFGGSNIVAATAGVPRFGLADGSGNAVTSQSANSHVAPDVVINDASGNRLNGLTTGTAGTASAQVLSVQGIASMTPLNTTLGAETTKVIGTVRVQGNVGGVMDFAGQNAASPANALLTGCQFNTSPTTVTSGNVTPVQCSNAGAINVAVVSGSTGNAAASATGSAVPAQAGYTGINVGGTLRGWTGTNPSGTVYTGQMDVAAINGATVVAAASGIQKVGISGATGATVDFAGQNAAAPANAFQAGCQFQTTPTTITAGNASPCQMDNAGNILVNVKTATGLAQGSTTSGQTGSMIMGAVTTANPSYTTAQTAYASLDVKGNARVVLGGGVPETISATGTTGATTATLATSASTTTYICGFSIRANATAAATGNATVTGTITGTMNFTQWTAPLASGLGVTEETFTPCIPASAANTTIAVASAAPGTGGVVSVSAWGYQQ